MLNELERKYERDVRAARQEGYFEGNREGRACMKQNIIEALDKQLADSSRAWILAEYSHQSLRTIKKYIRSFT